MKPPTAIKSWLKKKAAAGRTGWILGGLGLIVLAAPVLFVTFWLVYVVIYFSLEWAYPHTHAVRLWLCFAALVLLFIGNALADRHYLESYSFTTGTSYDKPVTIYVPGLGFGSNINPFAPESAHSFIKIITNIVCTGPRLVTEGFRLLGRAQQLGSLDLTGCAAVLAVLAAQDGRVRFEEVVAAVPAGHDVAAIVRQLKQLDAVMLLSSEPPGVTLVSEVRAKLRKLIRD